MPTVKYHGYHVRLLRAAWDRPLAALIEARQRELRDAARFLGRRLFDEQPKSFDARMKSYWHAWREAAEIRVNQEADVRAEI
jgi:hypothetical protein